MSGSVVPTRGELVDLFFRSLWTFVAGALGAPVATALFDLPISTLQGMAMAGTMGVCSVVLVYARQKLGTLPADTKVVK